MTKKKFFRFLSVALGILALLLLGYFWKEGQRELYFIPSLIVLPALIFSRISNELNE